MDYFNIVIHQLGMLIVYAVIGIIAVKVKILSRKGLDMLAKLITRIALPLLIFMNTINGTERSDFLKAWPFLIASAVLYAIFFLVGYFLRRLFGMRGNTGRVYHACAMFSNIGFMGIPILTALFPRNGILYVTLFTVVDQLVLWTVGVNLTLPMEGAVQVPMKKRIIKMINPCTVGIVLAVVFVFTGVKLPSFLNTALTNVGSVATPLAMIYLGGIFCFVPIFTYLKKKELYGIVVVKMFLLPILCYFVFANIPGLNHDMAIALGIFAAMPTMTAVAMLAQNQKSDGDYAAGGIFVTTVCSVLVVPLVCLIVG